MQLDQRKTMILQAIIDDYINTAVPVGSRTISRKSGVGYSPATIRNEMSDLEELGYLAQPHTSAGRVPSVKAYRLYVDELMKDSRRLTSDERETMSETLSGRSRKIEAIIRNAATMLADTTHYTAVIVAPQLSTLRIRHLQLVPVSDRLALMIIVTNLSIVKDALVRIPEGIDADELYAISRTLTRRLADKPLDAVRQTFSEILRESGTYRRLMGEALSVIEKKLEEEDDASDIVVSGGPNLLNYPEFSDVNKAKNYFAVLESKEVLRELVRRDGGMDVTIRIGPENGVPALNDCSVVTANYRAADDAMGTIGIIGPIRMDYNRVMSILEYVSRALSEILSDMQ